MSERSIRIRRRTRELACRDARPTGAGRDPAGESTESQGHAGTAAPVLIAAWPMALRRDAGVWSGHGNARRLGGLSFVPGVSAQDLALWFG